MWQTEKRIRLHARAAQPTFLVFVLALGMTWGVGTIVLLFYNGAILGAVLAGPRDAGFGAVFGGVTGAAIGSASDANAQAQANAAQAQANQNYARGEAAASNYRRAISACLDARGYKTA